MFRFILGLVIGLMFSFAVVSADKISSPSPLAEDSIVVIQHYLKDIYDNLHRLEIVTTNPDGVRSGKRGDQLHLQTGGNFYHCENTDSSTTWRCSQLTDVP